MPLHHSKDIGKVIRSLNKLFNDQAPRIVGVEAKNFFKNSFNKQGFEDVGVEPWEKRATEDKNRRQRRAILVKSARLKKSLQYKATGRGKVYVYSADVPYAKIHNEGGVINGTQSVRKHTRTIRGKRTSVKAHQRKVNITIPKRQFMGNSKTLNLRIEKELNRRINKIMNNV